MGAAQLCTDRYRIARLDQLSKSARELVRNPANLLAVIRVLEQGRTVPENEFDLHQTLLQPIIEKWQKDNVMSYLTELQLAAEVFAETGRSDVLTQRKFADQDALVEARVVIRRAGGLFFANDRLPAFLVADAIVKEPDAVSRMKLVANDQWRLIFDMISRELPLASVSVLVGALLESATPSGLTLAEYLLGAIERLGRVYASEARFKNLLDAVAAARYKRIVAGDLATNSLT